MGFPATVQIFDVENIDSDPGIVMLLFLCALLKLPQECEKGYQEGIADPKLFILRFSLSLFPSGNYQLSSILKDPRSLLQHGDLWTRTLSSVAKMVLSP